MSRTLCAGLALIGLIACGGKKPPAKQKAQAPVTRAAPHRATAPRVTAKSKRATKRATAPRRTVARSDTATSSSSNPLTNH